jgi:hypothetical protein
MPIEKKHAPKVAKKKEKVDIGRAAYMKQEAERTRAEKQERLAEAERKRQVNAEKELAAIKAAAAREKLPAELTPDDGPKLISRVVGKALGIPNSEKLLPKDVLELAIKQMPDVDVGKLAPKVALLQIAAAVVEKKAAKAAKEKAKKAAKEKEKADKLAAAAATKQAAREAEAAQAARASALQAASKEPEPEAAAGSGSGGGVEYGCVNTEIPDLVDDGAPAMTAKEAKAARKLSKKGVRVCV